MAKPEYWTVTVESDGVKLVIIESNCLSGKAELTDEDEDIIRLAAQHLKSFVGPKWPMHCNICGQKNDANAHCAVGGCPIGGDM